MATAVGPRASDLGARRGARRCARARGGSRSGSTSSMLSACSSWYPEPRGARRSHHQSSAERPRTSCRLELRTRRLTLPEATGAIAPGSQTKSGRWVGREEGAWPLSSRLALHLASGGGTSAASLSHQPASYSNPWAGIWLPSGLSAVLPGLGGLLRPHVPDAPHSAEEPGIESCQPATPLADPRRLSEVRCHPVWITRAKT